MEETITIIILFIALYGILRASTDVGKAAARWSLAIDELLKQRAERKKR